MEKSSTFDWLSQYTATTHNGLLMRNSARPSHICEENNSCDSLIDSWLIMYPHEIYWNELEYSQEALKHSESKTFHQRRRWNSLAEQSVK